MSILTDRIKLPPRGARPRYNTISNHSSGLIPTPHRKTDAHTFVHHLYRSLLSRSRSFRVWSAPSALPSVSHRTRRSPPPPLFSSTMSSPCPRKSLVLHFVVIRSSSKHAYTPKREKKTQIYALLRQSDAIIEPRVSLFSRLCKDFTRSFSLFSSHFAYSY